MKIEIDVKYLQDTMLKLSIFEIGNAEARKVLRPIHLFLDDLWNRTTKDMKMKAVYRHSEANDE